MKNEIQTDACEADSGSIEQRSIGAVVSQAAQDAEGFGLGLGGVGTLMLGVAKVKETFFGEAEGSQSPVQDDAPRETD
jgi:hypothetical protein